jgi:2-iminobutanoate/2-iminopropanoate deaminase
MKNNNKHFIIYIIILFSFYGSGIYSQSTNKISNRLSAAKRIITTSEAPKPIGPYSQAVSTNGFLFISGQIAIDPVSGKMDTADISRQTRRVMENINAIIKASDMDFTNVIKTTIYITDMSKFAIINDIYAKYFKDNFPARETVQVAKLPKNAGIEISMVAFK